MYDEYRTPGVSDDVLADRAVPQSAEAGPSVRTHDNNINTEPIGGATNRFRRFSRLDSLNDPTAQCRRCPCEFITSFGKFLRQHVRLLLDGQDRPFDTARIVTRIPVRDHRETGDLLDCGEKVTPAVGSNNRELRSVGRDENLHRHRPQSRLTTTAHPKNARPRTRFKRRLGQAPTTRLGSHIDVL